MMDIQARKHKRQALSTGDRMFVAGNALFSLLILLVVLYPVLYIVSSSFSSGNAVVSGKVWLWPMEPTLAGYRAVFSNRHIWMGFYNSFFNVAVGSTLSLTLTVLAAYPLYRGDLPGKGFLLLLFLFTMVFSAGMIPSYLLVRDLKLINTRWAMILPGAISAYNVIVMRSFFTGNIPQELLDASQIDGCSDIGFLIRIVLPVSKAVLAVVGLMYMVGDWNAYFNATIYLSKQELFPLQVILRDILINSELIGEVEGGQGITASANTRDMIKYVVIVVSTVPMLCLYPLFQRYFTKGVMLGAVKG